MKYIPDFSIPKNSSTDKANIMALCEICIYLDWIVLT